MNPRTTALTRGRALAILAAALLLVGSAGSVEARPFADVGGHMGWLKSTEAEEGNVLFGAHAEVRPLPWLGIHGSVDYRLANTYDLNYDGAEDDELKVRSVPITVSGRVYVVRTEGLGIFGSVGAGWYNVIYDYADDLEDLGFDDDSESTFGWHLGGGVVIPAGESMSVFGEIRAIFVDADRELDEGLADDVEDFDFDSTYVAGGVSFHF